MTRVQDVLLKSTNQMETSGKKIKTLSSEYTAHKQLITNRNNSAFTTHSYAQQHISQAIVINKPDH
jgi:hypothetical protein